MEDQPSGYQPYTLKQARNLITVLKSKVEVNKKVFVSEERLQSGAKLLNFKLGAETPPKKTRQTRKRKPIAEENSPDEQGQNSNIQNYRSNNRIVESSQCQKSDGQWQEPKERKSVLRNQEEDERPREAKNIIKNLVNGFKKFPKEISGETIIKIVKGEEFQPHSIKLQRIVRNWKKGSILWQVQNQFRSLFRQQLIAETLQAATSSTKQKIKYNKTLIEQIFRSESLGPLFKFWLEHFAHFYIVHKSKIKYNAQAEHRAAIDDLIDIMRKSKGSKDLKCPSFKHEVTNSYQDPEQSNLIRKSHRHPKPGSNHQLENQSEVILANEEVEVRKRRKLYE